MEATAMRDAWAPELAQVRLEDLPPVYREVAELIGLEPALALVRWRSGGEVSVPARAKADQPIARIAGMEAARKMALRYGGTRICLPTVGGLCLPQRNRAIRAEFAAGAPVTALAGRYGLSERMIRAVLTTI